MKKYKVELSQTETYCIDVEATTEEDAKTLALKKFQEAEYIGVQHFFETGDGGLDVGNVYDVTDTDDEFNP